jgi:hypothetical protein
VQIDCYLSPECASEAGLRENLTRALALEQVVAAVRFHRLSDDSAVPLGATGLPSVFINGTELQPQETLGFS